MDQKFHQFCGDIFWDNNLTWYTDSPQLTECFNKTVMVWSPPAFLIIFCPLIIYSLVKSNETIEWNFYNRLRQRLALLQIIFSISEFITVLVNYFQTEGKSSDEISSLPDITAASVRLISSILIFAIFWLQVKKGLHTSGVIWFYFFLSIICSSSILHGHIHWHSPPSHEWILFCIQFATSVIIFIVICFADQLPEDVKNSSTKKCCPKESASFISRLLFSWFTSTAILGYRKPLTLSDLWLIRDGDKSSKIHWFFNKNWKSFDKQNSYQNSRTYSQNINDSNIDITENNPKKYQTNGNNNKTGSFNDSLNSEVHSKKTKPGILRTIWKTFWFYFLTGAFFKLLNDILIFINPQVMKILMSYISDKSEYEWHGYLYAVLLFLVTGLQILSLNYYFNRMMVIGMRVRTCLVSAVYRKSLRLSNSAKTDATTGEIVNLMAVDAQRFIEMTPFINLIWSAPFQILLSIYFLWQELGISVLGGLAVMVIMIPINGYTTSVSKRLQIKQMKLKDQRVKAMNEILNGIKVLKLYGWEKAFMTDILRIRDREMNNLKTINYIGCVLQCLWYCAPFFVSFVSFAIYVLIDSSHQLTPQKAFVSLALFNILRFPLSMLPNLITSIIMTSVSVKRLNKFLNSSELSGYINRDFDEKHAITVRNASFCWQMTNNEDNIDNQGNKDNKDNKGNKGNKDNEDNQNTEPKVILKNIDLNIEKNSLVAIVGSVGSGKSSLLSALLGDMQIQNGFVNICSSSKIAYVPQQAWIQNTSLKNNILFGKSLDQNLYNKIIESCALKPDLDILPGGDETEIGEKGINLSGGQKQRVSVARACFSGANLFLLDDPLSAVDSHVGKHIFDEVIDSKTGLLRNSTRILVTNSLTFLPMTDKIIVIKDGHISETGNFNELMQTNGYFAELIRQHSANSLNKVVEDMDQIEKKIKSGTIRETNTDKSKLVEVERAETGRVRFHVYFRYFKAISWFWCTNVIITYGLMQATNAGSSVWLAQWSDSVEKGDSKTIYYLAIYGVLGLMQAVFVTYGWYAMTRGIIRAAKHLHLKMLEQIMHSPMSFFDTTPLGRILNRFSKDVDTCDSTLQQTIRVWLVCGFATITTIVIISMELPIFLAIVVPVAFFFYLIQKFYITTSRQLKRLESITKSPIYAHFSETLSGVATIRAYGMSEQFIKESDDRLDLNNECFYPNVAANRWLSIRLEMIANLIVFFSALFAVLYRDEMDASQVGLIVSYALSTTQNLNWLVRVTSDLETNIVGVERILEYTDLETEAEWDIEETAPQSGWPLNGNISFNDYSTKYRSGLDLVLKKISLKITPGEKIGIVGRTGAGKSSLTLGLFRLIEATEGNIIIDDINISQIGLHQLRSRLTIIPQDPILFSGTIRSNLDPFSSYSDEQLWKALELSHLKAFVSSLDTGLEHKVSEGGDNLSVGQRQLICLARALLRNTKVLILDEATAAVDLETDSLIQTTIRKAFSDCTVLTIAHRLNTILDSNRVLVLNEGRIAEFDSPENLLSNQRSIFYSLAKDAGIQQ